MSFAWSKGKKSSYNLENVSGVTFYDRHILSTSDLHDLAFSIRPVITVVSGWMDYGYLRVAFSLRSRNSLVVCGLDSQWNSTFRQHIASLLGSLGFFTRFSHCWVAGTCQYEYARYLGFSKSRIIYDLYSADLSKFLNPHPNSDSIQSVSVPHRFVFVGRLERVKGLDLLLQAWKILVTRDSTGSLSL